ncbi:hypothetical protein ABTX81_30595 [Kitasatospora sp. NPDC097605]|uniref:hypothetical protein n=1 Tax=Kitasatospora sp. NPDC097605 TaxID=3157226 RepID=UPI0033168086
MTHDDIDTSTYGADDSPLPEAVRSLTARNQQPATLTGSTAARTDGPFHISEGRFTMTFGIETTDDTAPGAVAEAVRYAMRAPGRAAPPAVPARLRIGHLTYTVLLDTAVVDEASVRGQVALHGFSSSGEQRIGVRADLPSDREAEVVLHEVLHQCLRVAGVDPDADAAAGLKDVEERAVNSIAGVLLAVLRDNPALTAYLTHQEPQ